jgi:hypothetical protein
MPFKYKVYSGWHLNPNPRRVNGYVITEPHFSEVEEVLLSSRNGWTRLGVLF